MTMADTIAVMHDGVVEQLGAPDQLYDLPATTFVANFLGQSNLLPGTVTDTLGDFVLADVSGQRVGVLRSRARVQAGAALVGVRPEKIVMAAAGHEESDGNTLTGGTVSDVSFSGVSTQYLVAMPSGQELTVFEQNTGARTAFAPGSPVDLHWAREHTFLLDAAQDIHAGDETYADRVSAGTAT